MSSIASRSRALRKAGSRCARSRIVSRKSLVRAIWRPPIVCALSWRASNPFGPNDKPVGGGTDDVKRITGDQRQDLTIAGIQDRDIVWMHDPGGHDAITVLAEQRGERNDVVLADVSQGPEEGVAVPGNGNVPRLSR